MESGPSAIARSTPARPAAAGSIPRNSPPCWAGAAAAAVQSAPAARARLRTDNPPLRKVGPRRVHRIRGRTIGRAPDARRGLNGGAGRSNSDRPDGASPMTARRLLVPAAVLLALVAALLAFLPKGSPGSKD